MSYCPGSQVKELFPAEKSAKKTVLNLQRDEKDENFKLSVRFNSVDGYYL